MNRADRRAAKKAGARGGHEGCGCTMRLLTPVELMHDCDCGNRVEHQTAAMPTAAPVGTLKDLYVSCMQCDTEHVAAYLVSEL